MKLKYWRNVNVYDLFFFELKYDWLLDYKSYEDNVECLIVDFVVLKNFGMRS